MMNSVDYIFLFLFVSMDLSPLFVCAFEKIKHPHSLFPTKCHCKIVMPCNILNIAKGPPLFALKWY